MPSTTHPTLQEATRRLLKEDGRPLKEIAKASRIPYFWLKKFSASETKAPGVDRVQRLYEFLAQRTLAL